MRHLSVAFAVLLLSACGTMPFQPTEYPLRDGLIAAFPVNGKVAVTNDQPSTANPKPYAGEFSSGFAESSNCTLSAFTSLLDRSARSKRSRSSTVEYPPP